MSAAFNPSHLSRASARAREDGTGCNETPFRFFCAVVLGLAGFFSGAATAPAIELPFNHLSPDNQAMPLPESSVQYLYQDRQGFIWMGFFSSGLARYDGHSLEPYGMADGLADLTVRGVVEDGAGHLWVGSESGIAVSDQPLDRYRPGERIRFVRELGGEALPQARIRHNWIAAAADGSVWVVTAKRAVHRYLLTADGVAQHTAVSLEAFGVDTGGVVEARRDGSVWVALETGPILVVEGPPYAARRLRPELAPGRPLTMLFESSVGTLWGGGGDGSLWRWSPTDGFVLVNHELSEQVISMLEDDGALWIGSVGAGVQQVDLTHGERSTRLGRAAGLPNETVWCIIKDHENTLWFSHNAGISRLRSNFRAFSHLSGFSRAGETPLLPEPTVFSVVPPTDGNLGSRLDPLWVGTAGGLTAVARGVQSLAVTTADGLQSNSIYGLARDSLGRIWVGTQLGLAVIAFGSTPLPPPLGPTELRHVAIFGRSARLATYTTETVYRIFETQLARHLGDDAAESTLWLAGTFGLICLHRDHWYIFHPPSGVPATGSSAVAADAAGRIWFSTKDSGLYRSRLALDLELLESAAEPTFEHAGLELGEPLFEPVWNMASGAPSNTVTDLLFDGQLLWAATAAGLVALHPETLESTRVAPAAATVNHTVAVGLVLSPLSGHLWITGNRGLIEVDPVRLEIVRSVDKLDGLADNESWVASSVAVAGDGTVYQATPKGLSLYRPWLDTRNPDPPPLRLRRMEIRESLGGNNEVVLQYAALSYSNEAQVRYRTRLVGYDSDWSEPTADTRIRYTNLNAWLVPWSYSFEVVAANDAGVWTTTALEVPFTVRPAWWASWWAALVYLVTIGALVVTLDSLRTIRLRRSNEELEDLVARRTAEIRSHVQELETLDEIVATVNRETELEKVMETLLEQGLVLLPQIHQGAFILRDDLRGRFDVVSTSGGDAGRLEGIHFTIDEAIRRYVEDNEALAEGVYLVRGLEERPGAERVRHLRSSSDTMLSIDLPVNGTIFGLLVFELHSGQLPVRRSDAGTLGRYRQHAITAIDKALVLRELEEKRREAEQANRAKSAFLANMSHELRTPLNSIIGFSEVLLNRFADDREPRLARFLNNILTSGQHLLSLINDLLDLSKIEAGKMELELTPMSLHATVDSVCAVMHGVAKKREVVIRQAVQQDLRDVVLDEPKLKQILYNLLSNAVKFSAFGSEVTVGARDAAPGESGLEQEAVLVEVSDDGIGIRPEDQESIFDEFHQVDDSASREYVGTGLGLALVRRYVEMMGGRIAVDSELGVGARFGIFLPANRELLKRR